MKQKQLTIGSIKLRCLLDRAYDKGKAKMPEYIFRSWRDEEMEIVENETI